MTKLRIQAGLLALMLLAAGCTRSGEPGPSASSTVPTASSTVEPTASSLAAAVASWPELTSVAGGYRLRHPPGWRAKESSGSGGPVLSLLPPEGAGISVLVLATAPPGTASTRPGTRCQPLRVGGLEGSRCLDTTSMVVTSILRGRERWYVLTASLGPPGVSAGTYDRVLASFRPGAR